MLGLVLCGLGMFRAPGQAQVLGGGPQVAHSGRAGARARSASPAGRCRAAERRIVGHVAMAGVVAAAPVAAAFGPPLVAAVAAGAIGGTGPSPAFHDPASTPRADECEFSITISALPSGDIPPIWLEL
eukprot:7056152-Prymnesium_polylepis.1